MRILFVGGSFDNNGGRPSSVVAQMASELECAAFGADIEVVNGGGYPICERESPRIYSWDESEREHLEK